MTGRLAYQAIRYHIMPLQDRSRHLSVFVIIVLDEIFVAHARLLLHEDGRFDNLSEM